MFKKVEDTITEMPSFTRQQLKKFDSFIKNSFGVKSLKNINPVYILEVLIPKKLGSELILVCVNIPDWSYNPEIRAVYDSDTHVFEVRSDLYSEVSDNNADAVKAIMPVIRSYLYWEYFYFLRKEALCMKNKKNSSC